MAQKAAKSLAQRNAATLKQTHLISLALNFLFFLFHFLFNRPASLLRYFLFASPALILEFYLEKLGRPSFSEDGSLRRPGEDLEAKGLTVFMWDIVYWTWIVTGATIIFGDRAWWLYIAVPIYSVYAGWQAVSGVRQGFAGMGGGDGAQEGPQGVSGGESKRQKKMEKRGGQKMQYR